MADTIFALSSGSVPAGVAVVRISGPGVRPLIADMRGELPQPRVATLGDITDWRSGDIIDRGIALLFAGPASFTGEDVLELQLHGSRAVLARLFDSLAERPGFRSAAPGEFARRAFANGKLDLSRAEALADLITAETEVQRRQALSGAGGALLAVVENWRAKMLQLRALVEATLDFADEGDVGEFLEGGSFQVRLAALVGDISEALESSSGSERISSGFRVALMGPPNTGKSTLVNAFAKREVAIVTPEPGTTRDVLELRFDLKGYPVTLFDTAGLRNADSAAEREGVRRAQEAGQRADLVLWVSEHGETADPVLVFDNRWTVRSKSDLRSAEVPIDADYSVSALTGDGMRELAAAIAGAAAQALGSGDGLFAKERQRLHGAAALRYLREIDLDSAPELIAESLRAASNEIGRITGRVGAEEVLDAVFSAFCIGK